MRSRWQSLTCRSINKYQESGEGDEKSSQSCGQTFTHTFVVSPFFRFFRSQQSLHNPLYGYQSLQPVSGRKNQLTTICLVCSITLFDSKHGVLLGKFILCMEVEKLVSKFFSNKVQKALAIASKQ